MGYRMGRRVVSAKEVQVFKAAAAPRARGDDYKDRLLKYIPAEVIAAFITVDGIIRSFTQVPIAVYWLVFLALLALAALYTWRVTSEPGKPAARTQIAVSTASFFVWVFALGGPFSSLSWYMPVYGALLLPIYTLAVALVEPR